MPSARPLQLNTLSCTARRGSSAHLNSVALMGRSLSNWSMGGSRRNEDISASVWDSTNSMPSSLHSTWRVLEEESLILPAKG